MKREGEIEIRIQSLGYRNVIDFFSDYPGVPYGILLRKIARSVEGTNHLDIPIFALRGLHRRAYIESGLAREFAKDGLIRTLLENIGRGWGRGKNADRRRARAYANWSTPSDDLELTCDRVWEKLVELNPPADWRPNATTDEYIEQAFNEVWPVE